jgi:gamma-glutamyl hercynylcysteine S-oxide hydrolase
VCRFAAYLGPPILLEQFLLRPAHNLVRQSWEPREMSTALMNADGFGIGWYDEHEQPAAYRLTHPIWSDSNLASLARSVRRPLWLAYVRSATEGFGTGLANTQPFLDNGLVFFHNGFISPFADRARAIIRHWLTPEIESGIHGNTDSEYLFACLRQLYLEDDEVTLDEAIRRLCRQLEGWLESETLLLNLALSDGRRVYALRHAIGADCPSLYYNTDDDLFPAGQLVASEPLTDSDYWRPLPPSHLLILDPDEPPQLNAL